MVGSSGSKMPKSQEVTRFERFLKGRGLKLTGERFGILEAVFQRNHHFDAETLVAELRQDGGEVSRATVYRTLDLLVQCGLVRKNSLGSNHANYEAARGNDHHDHLICLNCNKVIEFFRSDLERLQENVCVEQGFQPLHHSLQIFGLCADCKDKADTQKIQGRLSQLHT